MILIKSNIHIFYYFLIHVPTFTSDCVISQPVPSQLYKHHMQHNSWNNFSVHLHKSWCSALRLEFFVLCSKHDFDNPVDW